MESEPLIDSQQKMNPLTGDWVNTIATGNTIERDQQHNGKQIRKSRIKETEADHMIEQEIELSTMQQKTRERKQKNTYTEQGPLPAKRRRVIGQYAAGIQGMASEQATTTRTGTGKEEFARHITGRPTTTHTARTKPKTNTQKSYNRKALLYKTQNATNTQHQFTPPLGEGSILKRKATDHASHELKHDRINNQNAKSKDFKRQKTAKIQAANSEATAQEPENTTREEFRHTDLEQEQPTTTKEDDKQLQKEHRNTTQSTTRGTYESETDTDDEAESDSQEPDEAPGIKHNSSDTHSTTTVRGNTTMYSILTYSSSIHTHTQHFNQYSSRDHNTSTSHPRRQYHTRHCHGHSNTVATPIANSSYIQHQDKCTRTP